MSNLSTLGTLIKFHPHSQRVFVEMMLWLMPPTRHFNFLTVHRKSSQIIIFFLNPTQTETVGVHQCLLYCHWPLILRVYNPAPYVSLDAVAITVAAAPESSNHHEKQDPERLQHHLKPLLHLANHTQRSPDGRVSCKVSERSVVPANMPHNKLESTCGVVSCNHPKSKFQS